MEYFDDFHEIAFVMTEGKLPEVGMMEESSEEESRAPRKSNKMCDFDAAAKLFNMFCVDSGHDKQHEQF